MTLPSSINPVVALMQVQEKPNVTYADIGGCKNEIKKLQEVIEFPLLYVNFIVVLLIQLF